MTCEWLLLAASWLLVYSPVVIGIGVVVLILWTTVRINREPDTEFTGDQIDGDGR